jgi:hypothetical protein
MYDRIDGPVDKAVNDGESCSVPKRTGVLTHDELSSFRLHRVIGSARVVMPHASHAEPYRSLGMQRT